MIKKGISFQFIIICLVLLSLSNLNAHFKQNINKEPINFKTNSTQTRTDQWIVDLQANFNNPSWFYQNLNTTDRLMIRQAIDYDLPRASIIKSFMNGFASPLETYNLPQYGIFYNSSIQPLPYNLVKASNLLNEVFGYRYSPSNDNPNTPYDESAPYFPMNLMVPNSNPIMIQWANLITGFLQTLGISVSVYEVSYNTIIDRVFPADSSMLGWDFAHSGFDGIFINQTGNLILDDGAQYYKSINAPYYNYENINSSTINNLIAGENNPSLNFTQHLSYYYQLQQIISNQSLKYILFQNVSPYIYSKYLNGFNKYFARTGTVPYQNITFSNGQKSMVVDVSSKYSNLIPLLTNNVSDNYIINNLWAGGLLRFSTLPNDSAQLYYQAYPNIASSYTVSQNGMYYNFTLRPGIKWADGTDLTAQDVAFTYTQILNPVRNAYSYDSLSKYLNTTSIHIYDKYHIGFNLTNWIIPFPLGDNLFTQTIIPLSTYNISNWKDSNLNTGFGLTATQYNSNGPYQISNINNVNGSVNITINPLWLNSSYTSQFGVPGFNSTPSINSVMIQVAPDPTTAINNLKNGVVDWVDTNVGLTQDYSAILPLIRNNQISGVNITRNSWQEFGLNQASPIWGYSPVNFSYRIGYTTYYGGGSTTGPGSLVTGNIPTDSQSNNQNKQIIQILSAAAGFTTPFIIVALIIRYNKDNSKSINNDDKVSNNEFEKNSSTNFLKRMKKNRKDSKPNINIDPSLEKIEHIIEEDQK